MTCVRGGKVSFFPVSGSSGWYTPVPVAIAGEKEEATAVVWLDWISAKSLFQGLATGWNTLTAKLSFKFEFIEALSLAFTLGNCSLERSRTAVLLQLLAALNSRGVTNRIGYIRFFSLRVAMVTSPIGCHGNDLLSLTRECPVAFADSRNPISEPNPLSISWPRLKLLPMLYYLTRFRQIWLPRQHRVCSPSLSKCHFWIPWLKFAYPLCNIYKTHMDVNRVNLENSTRPSVIVWFHVQWNKINTAIK